MALDRPRRVALGLKKKPEALFEKADVVLGSKDRVERRNARKRLLLNLLTK
jgi:hypothetical protein